MKSRNYEVNEIFSVGRQGKNLTIELEAYNDAYKLEAITLDINIYEFLGEFGKNEIENLEKVALELK